MKDLLIVVPYRNRESHLKDFLNTTPNYFNKQNINYDILIAELDNVGDWNYGLCVNSLFNFNIGEEYKHIYIHDVDVYPINGKWEFPNDKEIFYGMGDHGSCVMKYESYFKAGGFSNNFWGWQYGDDCLYRRLIITGHEMIDRWDYIEYDRKNQNHERVEDDVNLKHKLDYIQKEYIDKNYFDVYHDGVYDTNNYGKTHSFMKIDECIYKQNITPLIKSPRELRISN